MSIKHRKISTIPDVPNADLVRPSDWNEEHVVDDGSLTIAKTDGLQQELDNKMPANTQIESIALANAQNAEMLEFDAATETWRATNSPQSLTIDGGNF